MGEGPQPRVSRVRGWACGLWGWSVWGGVSEPSVPGAVGEAGDLASHLGVGPSSRPCCQPRSELTARLPRGHSAQGRHVGRGTCRWRGPRRLVGGRPVPGHPCSGPHVSPCLGFSTSGCKVCRDVLGKRVTLREITRSVCPGASQASAARRRSTLLSSWSWTQPSESGVCAKGFCKRFL